MTPASERWAAGNIRVLERRARLTPLGIRFWDPVRDTQVSDGLIVSARLDSPGADRHDAFLTPSGIYAFSDLPGLYDVEHPGATGGSAGPRRRFLITVEDRLGRFVPASFPVCLPLARRGVYPLGPDSPPGPAPRGVFLFSSASRIAVSGFAAVRGQLHDARREAPAAHAWVDVDVGGAVWRGVADRTGAFAVVFPYPRLQVPFGLSPPVDAVPPARQRWRTVVRVGYDPFARMAPSEGGLPLLRSILDQPPALVWPRVGLAPADEIVTELTFGRELIVRTAGDSCVWIGRHGSPP